MRKYMFILLFAVILIGLTGCGDDEVEPYSLYKYTEWTATDGYIIQIREDDCLIGKDGKAFNQVCEFDSNANGSGVAKITICDKNGYNCESEELEYYRTALRNNRSIYIYGRNFYYTGEVKKNSN